LVLPRAGTETRTYLETRTYKDYGYYLYIK
jgi:hypothetical protein